MRFVEGVRDLNGILERQAHRERPALQAVRQRLSVEVLHDQEGGPAFIADVIQRADMRMIEVRDRARFALEALAIVGITSEALGRILIATVRSSLVSRAL